uniref:Calmodulin n=1 Tax=Pyramimonas obovata TaxID=1411642 RepID=A0A7S0RMM0_9CHLO|mmetsp:Transcript_37719/g.82042  ORF Transcript_37719/g.82042 Transcript_37719/m.82042 type:complete len:622 (+) Transcript_37719:176-2041(+)|eukprot:CAMPEP_0118924842 /NCGR_PEP_ID=MMETSP1169-20130426/2788_1 /TAXON_ID=36882 /ORGANISM="Pyramimonas obovata, Strain CCMP722" /LENGTH=621 /DNA_ID=CAMNT_0006865981 /DNA_START=151 /DNA_END=2016 /DNA_ORIENTATION=+
MGRHSASLNPKAVFVKYKSDYAHCAPDWETREEAVEKVFHHYQSKGSVTFKVLSDIGVKLNKQAELSEEEKTKIKIQLATDGERSIELEEFLTELEPFHRDLDPEDFNKAVGDLLYRQVADVPEVTYNPEGNDGYLQKHILPTLRAGLEELVLRNEAYARAAASWEEFPTGVLPDVYSPFCPLEWLADFLRDNNPNRSSIVDPEQPKMWDDLSREEKLGLCFKHLDRDGSGYLDEKELLALCSSVNPLQDIQEAKQYMNWMDKDEDNLVSWEEYTEAMSFFMSSLTDEEFEEGVQSVLAASHLSYFTRQEKLMMCFKRLDVDLNGTLEVDEMLAFGKTFDEGMDLRKARKTIAFMDEDGNRKISIVEFMGAVGLLTNHLGDLEFDEGVYKLLTASEPTVEVPPAVEKLAKKFKALVEEMPTHTAAEQMGAFEAIRFYKEKDDEGAPPLMFIDLRPSAESAVSTIPGATVIGTEFEFNDLDLLKTDMSFLKELFSSEDAAPPAKGAKPTTTIPTAAIVICYDTLGLRGGLGAYTLAAHLGRPVYNLCGGIIQWYSEGGEVRDSEGDVVDRIHPAKKSNMGFITRPNHFKVKQLEDEQIARQIAKKKKERFSKNSSFAKSMNA